MTEILTIQPTNSAGIQAALNRVGEDQEYDALRMMAGIYNINKPLFANPCTEIMGFRNTVWKLMSGASSTVFKSMTPILGQKGKETYDISVHGFCFDGNSSRQTVAHGKGFHNFCYFTNGSRIDIHNMILKNSQGDGARFKLCEKIDMSGCTIDKIGHDGMYSINCDTVNFFGNTVTLRTNSGVRTSNTNHVKIFDNLITGSNNWWAGNPGCQIDHSDFTVVDDVEVYNNIFYRTYGAAFWLNNYGEASTDLSLCRDYHIHDNTMVECGLNPGIDYVGGLSWSGVDNVQFEYNTLVDCLRYGISAHVGSAVWGTKPKGKGYVLNASKNVVTGTREGRYNNGVKTGIGIANTLFVTHSITSEENHVWNNVGGNYLNVVSETDSEEPLELDEEYHVIEAVDCGVRNIQIPEQV